MPCLKMIGSPQTPILTGLHVTFELTKRGGGVDSFSLAASCCRFINEGGIHTENAISTKAKLLVNSTQGSELQNEWLLSWNCIYCISHLPVLLNSRAFIPDPFPSSNRGVDTQIMGFWWQRRAHTYHNINVTVAASTAAHQRILLTIFFLFPIFPSSTRNRNTP